MNKITLGFFQVKSKTTIKGLLLVFALLLMNTQSSWGQIILTEDFNYTNATTLVSNGWAAHSGAGTNSISVTAPTISYAGYASSGVASEVTLTTSGEDVNKTFTSQTSGTIYTSFLVNVSSASLGGDYFFHLGASIISTTFRGRVFVKRDASNNVSFGIAQSTTTVNYSPAIYSLNTTYLIVLRYDIVAGTTNDVASIFVNPALNSAIPATGWISNTDASGPDLANIGTVALRQGGNTTAAALKVDGIRISKTWSDIVGASASTTWDGTVWSNGVPSSTLDAIIDGTYNTNVGGDQGAFTAKKLTVTSQGALTINSGTNVTVQNEVINNGSLVLENNANLIQVNNVANSGNVVVKRNSNSLYRLDYTLWSSPVASQNLAAFSPLTSQSPSRFYDYNSSLNRYAAITDFSAATFVVGKGNLIRMPNTNPLAGYDAGTATLVFEGTFTGVLNNGNVQVALSDLGNKFNLVGNPYASILDAELFLDANTSNIESTLYFWRKKNAASGSAYATYTDGGGTTTEPGIPTPNGKIQVGQGFFVQAKSTATVPDFFTNAMREVAPSSTQFYKTQKTVAKDRLWLNLTTATGVFSQALVAYISDAKSGLDSYDGKYINDSPIALTSAINNEEYTIQARPAFDATDVVALNFKTDVAGDYTIAIDHVDGLFAAGQDIYLVDSKTGTETNLKTSAYTFTTTSGSDNMRFSLKYQKTLNVDESIFDENTITVYKNNGNVFVKSANSINDIQVYDVQGRLILTQNDVNSNTATINNLKANHQILIVKVTTQDNKVVIKKVAN